ncbi:hypothetical protein PPACK8108_LOCUS16616 [Phakopsora pachyrhizi]|uniref:Uncharacterized protein n=1 Tax=Phakopsora pachyrhizi TaxID=170000 RepID=A0AAV0BBB7_PHAPC|nr:hypothetical protein PPACK8108_LOCUS16616 [Phakopsora pachyrhizi]
MHNSSSSSASSSTDSWDFDPDLIIPDGPLTLLQSDSENDTENSSVSSSIQFAPISSNVAYSTLTTTTTTNNLNYSNSSQSVRPRTDDSERTFINLVVLNLRMRLRMRNKYKFQAYEDCNNKRVEDGVEIEINSINTDKLRSRTSSTLSSEDKINYDGIKTEGPNDDLKCSIHASDFFDSDPDPSTSGGLAAFAYELDDLIPNTIEEQDAYINETCHRFLDPAQGFCIDHIQDDSNHEGESAVDKVPTNYKQSLSTRSSGGNIKTTSSSSLTGYSFPIFPHPSPHINRPSSTMTTSSSSRSIAVSIPHCPQSVATTSSTNSGRVKAAVSSNALSLAAPSSHSLKPPRLRTKSLKHTSSDPKIGDDHRPQLRLQHQASSSRVQSPSWFTAKRFCCRSEDKPEIWQTYIWQLWHLALIVVDGDIFLCSFFQLEKQKENVVSLDLEYVQLLV